MSNIRNSIKAVIIEDGKLLTIKAKDSFGPGFWYLLPGGGQDHGETMHEALKRECMEEINCKVKIKDLVSVREYIGKNHEFADFDRDAHQIEYMFECELEDGETPGKGSQPDQKQVGIEWLDIEKIMDYKLYPMSMREAFVSQKRDKIYFGDVN
jgi:8-oxo-dGTP diphosphatase